LPEIVTLSTERTDKEMGDARQVLAEESSKRFHEISKLIVAVL